MAIFKRTIQE